MINFILILTRCGKRPSGDGVRPSQPEGKGTGKRRHDELVERAAAER